MEKTIEIPEGYEARIEGNKVIIEQKESEDERIIKSLLAYIKGESKYLDTKKWIAYLERQKEQKPALDDYLKATPAERRKMSMTEILEKEQKPAEWSEVDKIHLMNAICAAEKKWGIDSCTANWLKSLRPSWKPSEEQMEALDCAIGMFGYMRMANTLRELYADLKNL